MAIYLYETPKLNFHLRGDRLVKKNLDNLLPYLQSKMCMCQKGTSPFGLQKFVVIKWNFLSFSKGHDTAMYLYLNITMISGDCCHGCIWAECEKSAFLMFTTNPAQLRIGLKVSQLFNSSPATLAGVCPCAFLLYQLSL